MIRLVVDRPSCRPTTPSIGLKPCSFAIPESVGKFVPRGPVDSRTMSEVFHETMNAPGGSKERRNFTGTSTGIIAREHPDSRLTHPQSCPTSRVHLSFRRMLC